MRLLIIGINFAPELTGVGKYTGEMAAWLSARGHEVSIITTKAYYPEWKRASGLRRWTWQRETWRNCSVIRCPHYVPRRLTASRRLLHLASFALSSIPAAAIRLVGGKVDVVAAIAPTIASAPLALATARLMNAKAWLHFQDLEVDAASGLGIVQIPWLIAGALRSEQRLVGRFDLVSAISPKMLDAVERKGVQRDRLMLFPNWVDTDELYPLPHPVALRRDLGIPEHRCVVLYSGSMGKKQGLDNVIAAARQLSAAPDESPLFILAGVGPARSELEESAVGLPNIRFMPLQPAERFNEFLNLADIHLLPQRSETTDLVMPSKLGGMLASGRPTIATVSPDSQIAFMLREAGVVVPPEDPAALADAIRALATDPVRRYSLGAAAARLARESLKREAVLSRAEMRLIALASNEMVCTETQAHN